MAIKLAAFADLSDQPFLMIHLRRTRYQFDRSGNCVLVTVLTVLLVLFASDGLAQSQSAGDSATLQGSVLDSRGRAVVAATVHLQAKAGTKALSVQTDSQGSYRFSTLDAGDYILHVEMAGYRETTFGPCAVGSKESKRVDLTLEPATSSTPQSKSPGKSAAERPEFFDEPAFTVAGVTEAMNPGGHGSNVILRTTEALAKETVSLGSTAEQKDSGFRTASAPSVSSARAEETLRKAAEGEPGSFDVNRQLGRLLVDEGKTKEALPFLEYASELNSGDFEISYELAQAYADAGEYERGRGKSSALLAREDESTSQQARVHHLLGGIEEKLNQPLEAVHEYQRAAELDPSESNLFDWGADLLLHRAYEPAIEVFATGSRSFLRSGRMLEGLGVAWYGRGAYDQASESVCRASDLNPDDPNPYLLLGKMEGVEPRKSACVADRLRRFVELQPKNALANYYYALSIWNRQDSPARAENLARVESFLKKAVDLDPKFGDGYLQLGIFYSDAVDSTKALAAYKKAAEVNPELEEAHYRLAQAYNRAGEKSKAQSELQLYERLSKKSAEEAQRERNEIQQFVYTWRDAHR